MTQITRTITIAALPEKVMSYISDVRNHTAFIPPLKSIEQADGDERTPGKDWTWTFEMGGVELKGTSVTLDYQEGKLFKYKTNGGIESTFTYEAVPEGDGSRLTIMVDYEVPHTVLGKIADKSVVERMNNTQADATAENIKSILEG